MSFKFHDADKIYSNPNWQFECQNNNGGAAGVVSRSMLVNAKEAEINFERARIWAKAHTPTGLRIMDAVRGSRIVINVVAWRSSNPMQPGFSMFSSDSPIPGEGTIYVNLDQLVSVENPGPEDRKKSAVFNNFVLILHEVGHAKQFIDSPAWFRTNQNTADYIEVPKKAILSSLAYKSGGKTWNIEAKADRILGGAHKAFSSAIEWENYIHHEGPICDEIGVARRKFYENIKLNFGDTHTGGGTSL